MAKPLWFLRSAEPIHVYMCAGLWRQTPTRRTWHLRRGARPSQQKFRWNRRTHTFLHLSALGDNHKLIHPEAVRIWDPLWPRTRSHPRCVNWAGLNQILLDWSGIILNGSEACISKTDYAELVGCTELDISRRMKTIAEHVGIDREWINIDWIGLYRSEPSLTALGITGNRFSESISTIHVYLKLMAVLSFFYVPSSTLMLEMNQGVN